ncbi:DUF4468 domain-containing protein [Lutibacter sp.]|uniref:DUF4468 domain-containing protein n=1 Tax=Lutibacter sp. TaxID=1925666 RepID=UPI001A2202E9|nr:DUF4468 domain-containing protein [Lutibacter sp.]MBI9041250.1 DUF4468 domain-containing protein [Lutibacter sp.]
MKNLLLTVTIILSNLSFGQEIPQLKLTPNGVEPIVIEVDDISTAELYNKALNWVQETYKNPNKVLKANIENEKIRIDGFASNAWWYKSMGIQNSYNMEYSIEISFKDGRYRFEYIVGQFFIAGGQKVLYDYRTFYKKDGVIRKSYVDAVPSLEQTMNELSLSFYNYVSGKTTNKEKDW